MPSLGPGNLNITSRLMPWLVSSGVKIRIMSSRRLSRPSPRLTGSGRIIENQLMAYPFTIASLFGVK